MGETAYVYIFGDETFDYSKDLHSLVHQNDDPLVISFFDKTYHALRAEIGSLPQLRQRDFERFASFAELSAQKMEAVLHPSLDQALSCAYQLARFIRHVYESRFSLPCLIKFSTYGQKWPYPKATRSCVIGVCSGALAAAAVSSSTTFSNLLPAAVRSVVISFRTGLRSAEAGLMINSSKDFQGDWSMLVARITTAEAQQAINDFSEDSYLPIVSLPFVSASSDSGVTISGPPSSLSRLRESPYLAKFQTAPLPIKTPYHAPHIFGENDINSILSTTSPAFWSTYDVAIPAVSTANGDFIWVNDFPSLLRAAVGDILIKPLRWDKIGQRLKFIAGSTRGMPVVVHQIGISADGRIRTALKQGGCDAPLILDQSHSSGSPDMPDSYPSKSRVMATSIPCDFPRAAAHKSKIAIVGFSGRFPDAENTESFWELLYEGRDVHKEVPPLHWDAKTHVDPTGKRKNTSATPFGCWLNHPELFDAKFFNISPREAPQIDPAQRIALLTAYEAIEQAGIVPDTTPSTRRDRIGVFYGVTSNDWMETNSAQNIDAYHIPGGNRAFIPGRINYFFNFSGPSFSVDTACSSSLASMHVACNALWRGEIDTAITGGTNILTNPDFTAGLDRGHFLSRTGNCKTFDDEADGYCRGEGIGTVILKRLEDAIFDGDPVHGVISGAYTNHSAEADSITRPFVGAQKDIFRKILNGTGVDPYDIGYVEMHGTGTQAGDGTEMQSVMDIFAPGNARQMRNHEQDLYVGSAKANIGHGEAASGIASLIKVLLMMENNTIPPHCGIKTKINHTFPKNLQERRVFIANKPTPWKRPHNGARKVFINNFSAAGGNTALLLEDAPILDYNENHEHRSTHVIAVSAKSASSIQGNLDALVSFLDKIQPEEISHLSWTTTARRIHHQHRVMVYGSDLQTIKTKLRRALEAKEGAKRPASAPKVAFAFTGQGSAYPGMGKELLAACSSFRDDIQRLNMIATSLGFPSFVPFLASNGEERPQLLPIISQLAIVCLEMALARLWISWGIQPQSVVGHSLGEYAALNVAGVLSDSDTIYLVGKRAQLLQDRCLPGSHSMLAVRTSQKPDSNAIQKILKGKKYEIACINSPEEFVISGSSDEIRTVHQRLADSNIKATMLDVPYAFHSVQVEPILSDFERAAQGVSFHPPAIPVLSPLSASVVHEEGVFSPHYLSRHCRKTVNLVGALGAAQVGGVTTDRSFFLEVGPHPIVSGMIRTTLPQTIALSTLQRKIDVWQSISQTLSTLYVAGVDIHWREYHRDFKPSQRVLRLPSYSWDLKEYWMQYVHDWSLRKGDPPILQSLPTQEVLPAEQTLPRLESTTIHEVIEETVNDQRGLLVVRSDISRSDLNPLVQGHKVNGVPLCTPSVYADIALSLGNYLKRRHWSHVKNHGIIVADMVIQKALIAAPRGPQLLQANVELIERERCAKCIFATVDSNGLKKAEHATCTIRFSDPSEVQNLQRKVPEIRSRISTLRKMLESRKTYLFNKSMIYKMVATLADFDPKYRALDEIVLDSAGMEASSIASFGGIKNEGTFFTNPGYIDALSQSAGFVMNANERSNLDLEVFVNHGWEAFQLFEVLTPDKRYETHVTMSETTGKMWKGDVLVLDGDRVVALFKGIALQGVARRLLHYILSTESASQTGAKDLKGSSPVPETTSKLLPQAQEVNRTPLAPKIHNLMIAEPKTLPVPLNPKAEPSKLRHKPSEKRRETKSPDDNSARVIKKALEIVSEESGIASEELVDGAVLSDVGIDSLLGLMISSRFQDEVTIDIDSSTLHSLHTIGGLKDFLRRTHAGRAVEDFNEEDEMADSESSGSDSKLNDQAADTHKIDVTKCEEKEPARYLVNESRDGAGKTEGQFGRVVEIISEETGIHVNDFDDTTVFTDAGIDSLLSLMISSRLSEELDIQAAADNTLFTTCNTIRDLRHLLAPTDIATTTMSATQREIDETNIETASVGSSAASIHSLSTHGGEDTPSQNNETSDTSSDEMSLEPSTPFSQLRRATSVILQGRPWTCSKTLFLFPDGAGTASSYTNLPKIHPDLGVLALNCPFVRHPQEMTCSLDQLMKSYLDEIKRRQPVGPYNFGGWSAGGILAYRAAEILIHQGEEVESLVLIDSPVPKGLDRLPQRFYDHLASIDLFGKAMPGNNTGLPPHLFAHFNATIEILHDYHAKALPPNTLKRISIIWATDCVIDGVILPKLPPHPDDTEGMKFLTEKRTDFTAQGWGDLFPGMQIDIESVKDAHHFSLMQHLPQAQKTSQIIRGAVGL